jgi:lantibiotic modifying enzyme
VLLNGDVAGQAFAWIVSVAIATGSGSAWSERDQLCDDLYAGTAGVLLAAAEAGAAGLEADGSVLRAGRAARDRLMSADATDDGLFEGWPGFAVALRAWATVTGDDTAGKAATAMTAGLAERMLRRADDPARCTDVISGDAGILLALVGDCDDPVVADAAGKVADGLVGLALDRPDGLHWQMDAAAVRLMRGFSHGTAGPARSGCSRCSRRWHRTRGGARPARHACGRCGTAGFRRGSTRGTGTTWVAAAAPPASARC